MPTPRFEARDLLRQVLLNRAGRVRRTVRRSPTSRRTIEGGEYRYRIWIVPWRGGRPRRLTGGPVDLAPALLARRRAAALPLEPLRPDAALGAARWTAASRSSSPRSTATWPRAEWSPDGRRVVLLAPSGEERFIVGDPGDPVARRHPRPQLAARHDRRCATSSRARGSVERRTGAADHRARIRGLGAAWHPDGERVDGPRRPHRPCRALGEAAGLDGPAGGGRPRRAARLAEGITTARWSPGGTLAVLGSDADSDLGGENLTLHVAGGAARPARRGPRPDASSTRPPETSST